MQKITKVGVFLFILLTIICVAGNVKASEKQTTTTTINGVTANLEYYLNDSNEIINLVCKNPQDLTGNITIPGTLDGKTVVEIGQHAFKGATNITGVTLPDSVKVLWNSFEECSNLTSVNLGKIEHICGGAFKDCPKLTTITLPNTLRIGPSNGAFTGTTNLTSVTFEEGSTKIVSSILRDCSGITTVTIPNTVTEIGEHAFQNSGLTSITLPDSVKSLSFSAFEGCANLESVNLNKLEGIGHNAFKDCPKLTKITIPKTLTLGPWASSSAVFTGTTNLTSVTFEEGSTKIPDRILQDCKGITTVTIPSTVTEIKSSAFKNSGIKEIELPKGLTTIEYDVFDDCSDLVKITIYDKVTHIGNKPKEETVFNNHNENLTIYCIEGSKIAEYAIANNIKYVYITANKDASEENKEDKKDDKKEEQKEDKKEDKKDEIKDSTTAEGNIPQTGEKEIIFAVFAVVLVIGAVLFIKLNKYKDMK